MTKPKHQHWVPQFYLKQFSTAQSMNTKVPKVWVWDKQKQASFPAPTSVRNICGQRYLYSPEDKQGGRSWEVEEYFTEQEGNAAEIWPLLLSGKLDLQDNLVKRNLAEFITLLHLRNVSLYRSIDKVMELRNQLYGAPTSEFVAQRKPSDPDPTHPGRYFVSTIIDNTEKIVKQLVQKQWMVMCASESNFVTADKPVIYKANAEKSKGGKLIIPLSSKRVLFMVNNEVEKRGNYFEISKPLQRSVNAEIESNAIQLVISSTRRK